MIMGAWYFIDLLAVSLTGSDVPSGAAIPGCGVYRYPLDGG